MKIISVHQPLYTAGLHSPGIASRTTWLPLFVKYKVSLVLQRHNHD